MATQRRLCIAADIKKWSTRKVPEQIQAQQSLAAVTHAACRAAGLPEDIAQSQGDSVLLLAPPGIDETVMIPAFVHALTVALEQENRMLADSARIRLRLSMTTGSISDGPTGFGGAAIVECFRLLDSAPVRAALDEYPNARLALIVSDHLYRDVIEHDFGSLRSADFWPARSIVKEFAADAWVAVSNRDGGPDRPPPAASPAPPATSDEVSPPRSFTEVDALCAAGDHDGAVSVLTRFLGEHPGQDVPGALLRLGRVHDLRGDTTAARHTWRYLLESHELSDACLELGRLEHRDGNSALARTYLLQGLRIARREKEALEPLVDALLDLPPTD
ncbi:MAG: tetratricopeptide repeat protein [Spirillospora sp.]